MSRSRGIARSLAVILFLAVALGHVSIATSVRRTYAAERSVAQSAADCSVPLQSLVDSAPAGSVVKVPACLYHEMVTINKPLTLDGQGQAEIRGSDVWADWSRMGSGWVSANAVPNFDTQHQGVCQDGSNRCNWPEQVFLDGTPLTEQSSGSTPNAGQFSLDSGRHVVIHDDPTGHVMEVSTRERWIDTQSDNVTIQGFTFWHAANAAETGAIGNQNRNGWTLQDNKLYYAHGGIVSLGGASNSGTQTAVLRNFIGGSGYEGIDGYLNTNTLIQGNSIYNNNGSGFDSENWSGGGVKVSTFTNLILDGNLIYNNAGPGLWCDIACHGVTFSNNRVHDNAGTGILFEISDGAKVFGNALWNTGQGDPAVNISSSANADVYGNAIAWNAIGVSVFSVERIDRPAVGVVGVAIHDNVVLASARDAVGLEWLQRGSGKLLDASAGNSGWGNTFWYPGDEDGSKRFRWQDWFGSISQFQATRGGGGARYLSGDERDQLLARWGIPALPG